MSSFAAWILRSRWVSAACLGLVVAAWLLPRDGFGFALCQFRVWTGLPCPSCGMTRSFISMARLDVPDAAFYHPAGVLLFPVALALAALLPVSARRRSGLAAWAAERPVLVNCLVGVLVTVYVLTAALRVAWLLVTGRPSPW